MWREPTWLETLADGTVKQTNPFTGTRVWTVAGRGNRPLQVPAPSTRLLNPADHGRHCAFCEKRYLETTPEKARLVRTPEWGHMVGLGAEDLFDTTAEFRRFGNLFEILTWDYWRANTGYEPPAEALARRDSYAATPAGRDHLRALVRTRLTAAGWDAGEVSALSDGDVLAQATGFFSGGHDVIVARRHFVDGAQDTSQLASAGTLSADEHARYLAFTLDAMEELYRANRYARYVAAFQNWLKPAGASFDHLHKQLVAIDEWGVTNEAVVPLLRANPNLFNEAGVNHAHRHNLVIARNEHAIAYAGVGHRYPTVEIVSTSASRFPWELDGDELWCMSELVHAVHAAMGPEIPCNEEWHHRPIDSDLAMPWRINVKWRVSTLAGFEGGTKIYLNTISPASVRERLLPRLEELRADGTVGDIQLGDECDVAPNPLRYLRG